MAFIAKTLPMHQPEDRESWQWHCFFGGEVGIMQHGFQKGPRDSKDDSHKERSITLKAWLYVISRCEYIVLDDWTELIFVVGIILFRVRYPPLLAGVSSLFSFPE